MKARVFYGLTTITLFISASLVTTIASAIPPYHPDLVAEGNLWRITDYLDQTPGHAQAATQGLCFFYAGTVGTHQRYTWVSNTYPDWNGRATQEGDQIFMHGDFKWPFGQDVDGGHDGMEWEIVTMSRRNEGAGHWKEWVEDAMFGQTIVFANAKFTRVGKCDYHTAEEALEANKFIEPKRDAQGRILSPMGVPIPRDPLK